jgi:lysophospholipase L1-like esterase
LSHITHGNQSELLDRRILADAYKNIDWADEYFSELWSTKVGWEPYTYWRYKSRNGNNININEEGLRLTIQAGPNNTTSPTVRIFMFGGSTLFGTGARDAFTIPSLFAKELYKKGIRTEVTNYGQSGYVTTQEVLDLIKELQQGNIPDAVIFYDGVNDVYSAYQNQKSGLPQNESNRRREFNISKSLPIAFDNFLYALSQSSKLAALLTSPFNSRKENNLYESITINDLAAETAKIYFNNIRIVKALSIEYNFKMAFYWQPTIFEKPEITEYEKLERTREKATEPLFKEVYRLVSNHNRIKYFYNLDNIFNNIKTPIFIDFCHISEEGNLIVAKEMANNFSRL